MAWSREDAFVWLQPARADYQSHQAAFGCRKPGEAETTICTRRGIVGVQQRTKRNAVFTHRVAVAHPVVRFPVVLVVPCAEKGLHRSEKIGRSLGQALADDGGQIVERVGHRSHHGSTAGLLDLKRSVWVG